MRMHTPEPMLALAQVPVLAKEVSNVPRPPEEKKEEEEEDN